MSLRLNNKAKGFKPTRPAPRKLNAAGPSQPESTQEDVQSTQEEPSRPQTIAVTEVPPLQEITSTPFTTHASQASPIREAAPKPQTDTSHEVADLSGLEQLATAAELGWSPVHEAASPTAPQQHDSHSHPQHSSSRAAKTLTNLANLERQGSVAISEAASDDRDQDYVPTPRKIDQQPLFNDNDSIVDGDEEASIIMEGTVKILKRKSASGKVTKAGRKSKKPRTQVPEVIQEEDEDETPYNPAETTMSAICAESNRGRPSQRMLNMMKEKQELKAKRREMRRKLKERLKARARGESADEDEDVPSTPSPDEAEQVQATTVALINSEPVEQLVQPQASTSSAVTEATAPPTNITADMVEKERSRSKSKEMSKGKEVPDSDSDSDAAEFEPVDSFSKDKQKSSSDAIPVARFAEDEMGSDGEEPVRQLFFHSNSDEEEQQNKIENETEKQDANDEEQGRQEQAMDDDMTFVESQMVPQVRLRNGEFVLDEGSLQVTRNVEVEEGSVIDQVIENRKVTSATYGKRKASGRWTVRETDLFYEAISQMGSDLEMISLYFPNRTRSQMRSKWRREDKSNPMRITEALMSRKGKSQGREDLTELSKRFNLDLSGPCPDDPMEPFYLDKPGMPKRDLESPPAIQLAARMENAAFRAAKKAEQTKQFNKVNSVLQNKLLAMGVSNPEVVLEEDGYDDGADVSEAL